MMSFHARKKEYVEYLYIFMAPTAETRRAISSLPDRQGDVVIMISTILGENRDCLGRPTTEKRPAIGLELPLNTIFVLHYLYIDRLKYMRRNWILRRVIWAFGPGVPTPALRLCCSNP